MKIKSNVHAFCAGERGGGGGEGGRYCEDTLAFRRERGKQFPVKNLSKQGREPRLNPFSPVGFPIDE